MDGGTSEFILRAFCFVILISLCFCSVFISFMSWTRNWCAPLCMQLSRPFIFVNNCIFNPKDLIIFVSL